MAIAYGYPPTQVEDICDDLGLSGAGTQHRPGWKYILSQVITGTVSAVFATQVSRLSRQLRDFSELLILARIHNVILIIDGRPIDPNDPSDTFVLQVLGAFAQHDNETRTRWMSQARRKKAEQGQVVSRLPLGWIEQADGTYEKDPELKDAIDKVFRTFSCAKSTLGTVRSLNRAGQLIPVRLNGRIEWRPPRYSTIRTFLKNLSYCGHYVFGSSESRPDLGFRKDGYPVRRAAPDARRIVVRDHHPPYITDAQYEENQRTLASRRFEIRNRAGNGSAICQGLLRCLKCNVALSVEYPSRCMYRYVCGKQSTTFARPVCFSIKGDDIDAAVERIFFRLVTTPPVEALKRAIAETVSDQTTELQRIEAQHKRLEYEERIARDRYNECDPRRRLLAADLEERLDNAIQARLEFEKRRASTPSNPNSIGNDEDIHDLCVVVADIPTLWRSELVSNKERKQLLACLIAKIDLSVADQRVNATITWHSRQTTDFFVWRPAGIREVIRELHDQGLTVPEIRDSIARGDPRTGQNWPRTRSQVYTVLKTLKLRPHPARKARNTPRKEK